MSNNATRDITNAFNSAIDNILYVAQNSGMNTKHHELIFGLVANMYTMCSRCVSKKKLSMLKSYEFAAQAWEKRLTQSSEPADIVWIISVITEGIEDIAKTVQNCTADIPPEIFEGLLVELMDLFTKMIIVSNRIFHPAGMDESLARKWVEKLVCKRRTETLTTHTI